MISNQEDDMPVRKAKLESFCCSKWSADAIRTAFRDVIAGHRPEVNEKDGVIIAIAYLDRPLEGIRDELIRLLSPKEQSTYLLRIRERGHDPSKFEYSKELVITRV